MAHIKIINDEIRKLSIVTTKLFVQMEIKNMNQKPETTILNKEEAKSLADELMKWVNE